MSKQSLKKRSDAETDPVNPPRPASETGPTSETGPASEIRPPSERILTVARELFCRDGIHATGIDRILADAHASKMTLYARFGSKEALVREVLTREGADWRDAFFAAVRAGAHAPLDRLRQVIPAIAAWFDGGRFYGCAFINAVAEHAKGEPALRALAAEHHRHILAFLGDLAEAADLPEPALVARQILLTMDGAIAALMVSGDPAVLAVARKNLDAILAAAESG